MDSFLLHLTGTPRISQVEGKLFGVFEFVAHVPAEDIDKIFMFCAKNKIEVKLK